MNILKIKLKTKITTFLIFFNALLFFNPINAYATSNGVAKTSNDFMDKFQAFANEYKPAVNIALGGLLLLSMLVFIYHVVQLAHSADCPPKRAEAIHNLLICGVCLAIQGSISIFIMLFFYLFS